MATKDAQHATVTIHDEPTRCVISQVIWGHASTAVNGQGLDDLLYEHSWKAIDGSVIGAGGDDPIEEVLRVIDLLDATRAAAERLKAADLGDAVELPFSQSTLTKGVAACKRGIESGDSFWRLGRDRQAWIVECRDAALRLLDELGAPVEAVA